MKDIYAFLLLMLCSTALFSQSKLADLVFKDGDTIPGYGMITNSNKLKFRMSLEEEADVYEGLLVKEIIFYGDDEFKIYEFVKTGVKRNSVLMEVLVTGKTNLYELKDSYNNIFSKEDKSELLQNSRNRYIDDVNKAWFLKRKQEPVVFRIGKSFKQTSVQYFKDCGYIKELFNSREYLKFSKKEIIEEYNTFCTE